MAQPAWPLQQRPLAIVQAVVRTLMKHGVSPLARDASGKTALDVALARARGDRSDALVQFMLRTARLQRIQRQGREARRADNRRPR